MTKKIEAVAKILLCVLLVFSIAMPTVSYSASAEENNTPAQEDSSIITLDYNITYGQTEARSMLALINAFRTSTAGVDSPDGAWYWDENDTDKVEFNTSGGTMLNELVYDYELERAAMQRAAEVVAAFSHTRPNGKDTKTILAELNITDTGLNSTFGENLTMGYAAYPAADAFASLQEKTPQHKYENQGHRRAMLSPAYNRVGIGYCKTDDFEYWVQIFGYTETAAPAQTTANDSVATVSVEIDASRLTLARLSADVTSIEIPFGATVSAPDVVAEYNVVDDLFSYDDGITLPVTPVWTSSNDTVVVEQDGRFVARNAGTANMIASLPQSAAVSAVAEESGSEDRPSGSSPASNTVSIPVTVTPTNISDSDITLAYSEIEYTGEALKPAITSITLNGTALDLTDPGLTVSYSDVVQVGTGKVTVTGSGNYTGTATKTFTIKECQHVYAEEGTVVSEADCTNAGEKKFECTKCDKFKTETIAATGHTNGTAATCTTPQKCTVCDAVIKEALGHTPKSGSFDCAADQTCSVCNEVYHKAGSHTPGDAATCTTDQTCTVCKKVVKQATGHTPGTAATCTTDQTCTVCKTVLKKALGHNPGAAPTCGTPQKCTICATVLSKATEKHTDANNDQKCDVCGADTSGKGPITGEIIKSNLPVIIAFAVVIVSAIVILVVLIKQRGRNSRRGQRQDY